MASSHTPTHTIQFIYHLLVLRIYNCPFHSQQFIHGNNCICGTIIFSKPLVINRIIIKIAKFTSSISTKVRQIHQITDNITNINSHYTHIGIIALYITFHTCSSSKYQRLLDSILQITTDIISKINPYINQRNCHKISPVIVYRSYPSI